MTAASAETDGGVRYLTISETIPLASGEHISDVRIAYETWGELSAAKDNAVLICHALSGDSHVADGPFADSEAAGWWNGIVGPGKAIDTDRYFVICSNVLGGCSGTTGPSSPHPFTGVDDGEPGRYGLSFPLITIEDMVDVEYRLVESLGIKHLLAVVGGSLGGMQALTWAKRYPASVGACIATATTWRTAPQAIAFNEVGRRSIIGDPLFNDGRYCDDAPPAHGLSIARMIGHITYLSDESMNHKFGRRLIADGPVFTFEKEFEVESYLEHQGSKFVDRFDANSYLYLTRAMDYFALAPTLADVAKSFSDASPRFLLLSFSTDWLFPPGQMHELVGALSGAGAEVTFAQIEAPFGHDSFLLENEVQGRWIDAFLSRAYKEVA